MGRVRERGRGLDGCHGRGENRRRWEARCREGNPGAGREEVNVSPNPPGKSYASEVTPLSSRLWSALTLQTDLVRWRRDLHQIPELGFQEHETQAYLARELESMGLEPRAVAGTGLSVDIGSGPGRVLVRADMDGLPIEEATGAPYRSRHGGVMHACGHDAHMAIALGTARLLADRVASRRGEIPEGKGFRVIFQPSEERHPGGAPAMIAGGVLKGVTHVLGCHVRASFPLGLFGSRVGVMTANSDRFTVEMRGRGGHGSTPHLTNDPVPAACEAVLALQTVVSRRVNPREAAVVTVSTIQGGTAPNVIGDMVTFGGTVRTLDGRVEDLVEDAISQVCRHVAEAHGVEAKVEYVRGYPSVVNTEAEVATVRQVVSELAGAQAWRELDVGMGGEDFSYYLKERPGVFWILGTQKDGGGGQHTATFDLDERALPDGVSVMTETALSLAQA